MRQSGGSPRIRQTEPLPSNVELGTFVTLAFGIAQPEHDKAFDCVCPCDDVGKTSGNQQHVHRSLPL
jgi:hypothetical protein